MKLDAITIREGQDEYESLALAIRAVAAVADVELDYDDLCAALGASFTTVSTPVEPSPGWWLTYGRDVFLLPAAKLFGLELRPLHAPAVGIDMLVADEFVQHFEQSYKPLIRAALDNKQPVIAWQGWPDFCWPFWGVITAVTGNEFEGTTMWAEGKRQQLGQPALQCYVVERCQPMEPPRDKLFATAMKHADAYMNHAPYATAVLGANSPNIVTGPAALDAWEDWLSGEDFGDPTEDESWNEHRQHAEFIATGRLSAARFLNRHREIMSKDRLLIINEAIACCESLVNRLTDSRDEKRVKSLFATDKGRQKLLQTIHAAEADDRRLAMQIELLSS
ncbi:MAG: hypothetical protein JSV03_14135 [Planctomycetota bacterium]|nr:MAG: hypothetical protein JSV03_14135 [Planctomycetota bacterium]